MPFDFITPEGAMYVYPRLRGLIQNDVTLVEKLLNLGVAVAPGSGFGENYKQFMRISACQPKRLLEQGLEVIRSSMLKH
jgi:aspartate aminotransferase